MYFWRITALKKLIIERGLTEAQVFYYVLLYVAATALGLELDSYFPYEAYEDSYFPYEAYEDRNEWDNIWSGLNIAIPILGTICAYRANGGAAGAAFAAKYFSISFVVGIRLLVYLTPLMAAVWIAYHWSSFVSGATIQTGWFDVVISSAWLGAVYAFIVKHIRDTTKA